MTASTVVVIGGGPAGSLTAYLLARTGVDVALIERGGVERPDRGEVLAAEGRAVLANVGLWDRLPRDVVAPCESTRIAWRPGPPAERFAITNPYGCAWYVNRPLFDAWLFDEAVNAGAHAGRRVSVRSVRRNGRDWDVVVDTAIVTPDRLVARVVVHATGRCSALAARAGATVCRYDSLCATIGQSTVARSGCGGLAVEATPDGWWYSTERPEGRTVVALLTDPDLLVASSGRSAALQVALERAPLTRARVGALAKTTKTVSARSAALEPASGDGWLAVGDAAIARDPLSGEGILSAMRSAIAAATAVQGYVRGDFSSLVAYADAMRADVSNYLATRRAIYAGQTRWSDQPFWQRRSATSIGSQIEATPQ